jgi:predicted dithiol-disulfide oxidoreductase (DUF899 family)
VARLLHSAKFPGETDEYRGARNSLLQSEIKLRRQFEAVAEQRRALPLGGQVRKDYEFEGVEPGRKSPKTIRFSELFAPGKRTLLVYNFMFPESPTSALPCPSCTSIIDAIDGAALHVVQRINFAVVAKAPIEAFREHAHRRGWRNSLLLSSADNDFNSDYHAEASQRAAVPARARVYPPRQANSPHLEQRVVVRTARSRTGHAPRRFHVADVEHLRHDAGGTGQDLGTEAPVLIDSAPGLPHLY